jgi:hypothetical protein
MGNEVEFSGQNENEEGTAEITEVFTKYTKNQPITSVYFAPSLCLSRLSSSMLFWALSFDIAPSTPFDIAHDKPLSRRWYIFQANRSRILGTGFQSCVL